MCAVQRGEKKRTAHTPNKKLIKQFQVYTLSSIWILVLALIFVFVCFELIFFPRASFVCVCIFFTFQFLMFSLPRSFSLLKFCPQVKELLKRIQLFRRKSCFNSLIVFILGILEDYENNIYNWTELRQSIGRRKKKKKKHTHSTLSHMSEKNVISKQMQCKYLLIERRE